MYRTFLTFSLLAFIAALSLDTSAQTRIANHGFDEHGVFHFATTGAAEVEASTNLQTWTKFASLAQAVRLDDTESRPMGWRFYRLATGANGATSVVGFVKVTIAPSKMAILGNPFASGISLDSPERRLQIFGITNPPIKLSVFTNGGFVDHILDRASGRWSPAFRAIRVQEGFSVENLGTTPLQVRLNGEVRQGQFNLSVPVGSSLVVPPVPRPGTVAAVLGIPGKDGVQLDMFNEETQTHQTSTFDTLENKWLPKAMDYRPGRAFLIKTPAVVNWTMSFPAADH